MIICVSTEAKIQYEANCLALKYNEHFANYGKDCLANLDLDTRITFIGHSRENKLGYLQLTPEMFVADLISFGLPQTVKIIDLVSCQVGECKNEKSYAAQVTQLFSQHGYYHLQVNAFSNYMISDPMFELRISTGLHGSGIEITALTFEQKQKLDKVYQDILQKQPYLSLLSSTKEAEYELSVLHRQRIECKLSTGSESTVQNTSIVACEKIITRCEDILKKLYEMLYDERCTIIFEAEDIRHSLDHNKNFQNTAARLLAQSRSSTNRKLSAIHINNRISKLHEELFASRQTTYQRRLLSYLFAYPSSETICYQIHKLEMLESQISNPDCELETLYKLLSELYFDSKMASKENARLAEKVLAALQINSEFLQQVNRKIIIL